MTDACHTCDFIGPDADATVSALREVHRALHDAGRTLRAALAPLFAAVQEQGERERQAAKNAFVLMNESVAASLRGEK